MKYVTHSCRFNNVDQLELEWKPGLRSHRRLILTISRARKTPHQVNVAAKFYAHIKSSYREGIPEQSVLVKPQDFTKNDERSKTQICAQIKSLLGYVV